MLRRPLREQEARQHRDDGDREDRPGDQREGERQRHGTEDASLDPLQREERHEGGEQDRLREQDRTPHVTDRLGHGLDERLVAPLLLQHQEVLDDHDRRVDDDPEVDRAHGDQVGGDAAQVEQEEGAEERQRDDRATISAERQLPSPRNSSSTMTTSAMPSSML